MIDKDIGQNFRAHAQAAIEQSLVREELQYVAAEAADRALFDRDQNFVICGQLTNERLIERLCEPRIGDCRREAEARKLIRSLQAFGQTRSERKQRDFRTLATMRPLPISSGTPSFGNSTPTPSPRG